jgi:AcrR family transcriptional regulator
MVSPDTRDRLLDAAWAEATERGVDALTLASVGRRAGVTRQAVYLHFGNRASLLVAMARRADRTSGFRALLAEARSLPPVDGFVRVLRAWFAYVPRILPVAIALEAAQVAGGDGAEAYRDRMADWRAGLRLDVERLADAGALHPGWGVDEATDWVWAQVHPSNMYHLTAERGWPVAAVAERTIAVLTATLVVADVTARPDPAAPS